MCTLCIFRSTHRLPCFPAFIVLPPFRLRNGDPEEWRPRLSSKDLRSACSLHVNFPLPQHPWGMHRHRIACSECLGCQSFALALGVGTKQLQTWGMAVLATTACQNMMIAAMSMPKKWPRQFCLTPIWAPFCCTSTVRPDLRCVASCRHGHLLCQEPRS